MLRMATWTVKMPPLSWLCIQVLAAKRLPIEPILQHIPNLAQNMGNSHQHWLEGAWALATTDTFPKLLSTTFTLPSYGTSAKLSVAGITKGAGMVFPNMQTTLGIFCTDAPPELCHLEHCSACYRWLPTNRTIASQLMEIPPRMIWWLCSPMAPQFILLSNELPAKKMSFNLTGTHPSLKYRSRLIMLPCKVFSPSFFLKLRSLLSAMLKAPPSSSPSVSAAARIARQASASHR